MSDLIDLINDGVAEAVNTVGIPPFVLDDIKKCLDAIPIKFQADWVPRARKFAEDAEKSCRSKRVARKQKNKAKNKDDDFVGKLAEFVLAYYLSTVLKLRTSEVDTTVYEAEDKSFDTDIRLLDYPTKFHVKSVRIEGNWSFVIGVGDAGDRDWELLKRSPDEYLCCIVIDVDNEIGYILAMAPCSLIGEETYLDRYNVPLPPTTKEKLPLLSMRDVGLNYCKRSIYNWHLQALTPEERHAFQKGHK